MAGFVSCPPATAPDPAQPAADMVAGDDFYPGISLDDARDFIRLPTQVTDARLRDAIRGGVISVRRELRAWKTAAKAAGAIELGDVDLDEVDGTGALELLYRRAVLSMAAADIAETHNDISATNEGKARIDVEAISAGDHRRNATYAIRDMLGRGRTDVELI